MEDPNLDNSECCRRSFGASLRDTAKRLFENPKLAPRSVVTERIEICNACDHYKPDTTQCDICLCFMPIKAAFANVECPVDKWTAYSENWKALIFGVSGRKSRWLSGGWRWNLDKMVAAAFGVYLQTLFALSQWTSGNDFTLAVEDGSGQGSRSPRAPNCGCNV